MLDESTHKKIRPLTKLEPEKITFPPKPDRHTYRQTYRRTDICFYRVASLLKTDEESVCALGYYNCLICNNCNFIIM